jgi:hypothetical protein
LTFRQWQMMTSCSERDILVHPWDQDSVSTDTSMCPCGLLRWCTRPMHDLFPSLVRTIGTAPDSYTTAPSKQSNKGDLFSWARSRSHTKSKGTIARSLPFYCTRTHSSPSRLVQLHNPPPSGFLASSCTYSSLDSQELIFPCCS